MSGMESSYETPKPTDEMLRSPGEPDSFIIDQLQVPRREFIGAFILAALTARHASPQEPTTRNDLVDVYDLKSNPELERRLYIDTLSWKLAQEEAPNEALASLVKIFDITTQTGLTSVQREEALNEVIHIAELQRPLAPDVFDKIISTANPAPQEHNQLLDAVPKTVSWGVQTVGVVAGAYAKLDPRATVALGVAGILAEPVLDRLVKERGSMHGIPPRASVQHFREIAGQVAARLPNPPNLQAPRALINKSVDGVAQGTFNMELRPQSFREAFEARIKGALAEGGIEAKNGQVSKTQLKAQLTDAPLKSAKRLAENPPQPREPIPSSPALIPQQEMEYYAAEIRGAGTVLGGVATLVGADPKLCRAIPAIAAEVSNFVRTEWLFSQGLVGPMTLAGGFIGVAFAITSLFSFGKSSDQLVRESLAVVHRKLDALLKSNQRIEERQLEILKALSSIYQELWTGNIDQRKRLITLQTTLDTLAKRAQLEVRQSDFIELMRVVDSCRVILEPQAIRSSPSWMETLTQGLRDIAIFAEKKSRKASFSGDSDLVSGHASLGRELLKVDDFNLSLGFLPQLGAMFGNRDLAALRSGAEANIPNPHAWALGVTCYLETLCLSGGVGEDVKQLHAFWRSGIQIRQSILLATSQEMVTAATDQFLKMSGARRDDTNVPTPTGKEHWELETNKTLVAVLYRKIRDFILQHGLDVKEYSLKERLENEKYIPSDIPHFHDLHGDYFGVDEQFPGTLDGFKRHIEITNCPIDAMERVKALKLTKIGKETRYHTRRDVFVLENIEPLGRAFVERLRSGYLRQSSAAEDIETKYRARLWGSSDKGAWNATLESLTGLLDVCQSLAFAHAKNRIQRELPGVIEEFYRSIIADDLDGIGAQLRLMGTLIRVRMIRDQMPPHAERITEFGGLFSGAAIMTYLQNAISTFSRRADQPIVPSRSIVSVNDVLTPVNGEDFPSFKGYCWDPGTLAEIVTKELCAELHRQCEELGGFAQRAPEWQAYVLVDETLRRLAGYMCTQGIALPEE